MRFWVFPLFLVIFNQIQVLKETKPSWFYLLLLILSGEAIFILPFVLPRVFRPTVLDVLELDNVQMGLCFSVYGLVAMVSYVLGGPLADKYQPRKLIAIALWMTALGGFLFAQYPDFWVLQVLYGWWGFTTIFLFWAPMIKATRIWGGADSQGKAFGFLDGGRGLTGALFGLMGVVVFSFFLLESPEIATLQDRKDAFTYVLYFSSVIIILVGVLVWFFMKTSDNDDKVIRNRISWADIKQVLKLPSVWLLMVIILCGYVGYKITDVISQYAEEVMLYNQVDSAKVGTLLQFLRPATGILFGLIADKLKITWLLVVSFILTLIGGLLFASGLIAPTTTLLFFMSVVVIAAGLCILG